MIRSFQRFLLAVLCLLTATVQVAWAQALPAQTDRVNRALSGAIESGLQTRGFAANDPRFGNTLARISPAISGVAGTAGAIAVGTVSAPSWASVALVIGIGAVITYAVNLGLDALVHWLFRTDNKIDESGDSVQVATNSSMSAGAGYWGVSFHSGSVNIDISGGNGEAIAREGHFEYLSQTGQNTSSYTPPNCSVGSLSVTCGAITATFRSSGAPSSCPAGQFFSNGACGAYKFLSPSAVPLKTGQTAQQATSDIPATDLNKPLNPAIIAALADAAWQRAAQSTGYDGVPYPQSNPLTSSEVQPWLDANPSLAPTINDFVAPNPTTSSNTTPWALPLNPSSATTSPALTPNANTTNPASANPLTNLGPDPGIGAPELEATPTAHQILDPVLNMLPSLRNFSPTNNAGACPRPTIELYGTHVLDAHCTLIDANKPVIQAAMLFAWAAMALFIVLSA